MELQENQSRSFSRVNLRSGSIFPDTGLWGFSPPALLLALMVTVSSAIPQARIGPAARLRKEARAAVEQGELEQALASYRQAAVLEPHDVSLQVDLAQLLKALNRPLQAISAFETALQMDPQNEPAELGLSDAYRQVFNYAEARRLLERSRLEHPKSAAPLVALGELDIQFQQYKDALLHLRQALRVSPANLTAHLDLAAVYHARGDLEAALKELNLVIGRDPNTALAYYLRGSIYADRDEGARALLDAQEVGRLQPNNPRGRILMARIQVHLHQCAEAVELLQPLMGSPLEDAETLYLLARAYHCAGQEDLSTQTTAKFAERSKRDHSLRQEKQRADDLAAQAGEMARKNQQAAALDLLNQALAKDPENGQAYAQLAKIYYSQGKWDKAREAVERALKSNPYAPDCLYVLGRLLAQQGDLPAALRAFEQTLQVDPQESDAYYEMGMIYVKLKDRARALEALKKAVELSPDDADYRRALENAEGGKQKALASNPKEDQTSKVKTKQ